MSEEQKKETTFEQSLARLERIVSEMEGGTLPFIHTSSADCGERECDLC